MRLTPREPEIPKVGGFSSVNDIFGYRDFAGRLANLVRNVDEPLVIALDGPWGSGKSIFVRQWAGLLRQRGATVIHFDAFRNDHYEDAFIAFSAAIHTTAKQLLGSKESTARRHLNRAKKVGVVLAPVALRVAARAGTAGLLSLEDMKAGGEALKAAVKVLGNESERAVEKVVSDRIQKAAEEDAILEDYRRILSEISGKLAERHASDGRVFPLVFIVDELDRCRPPFALSVIERIKHLFSVPGVCFVLVTHLPHLEQVFQGAYGTTFDAQTYLEKFYQIRVFLPEDKDGLVTQRAAYVAYLWKALEITFPEPRHGELVQREIKTLAEAHGLSLRRIERVITCVALVCAAAVSNQLLIPPLVAGLCVMRQTHPVLYKKARVRELSWSQVHSFLQPTEGQGVQSEWTLNWWKYAIGEDLPEPTKAEIGQSLWRYNVDDRQDLLPFMAKFIDELVQQESLSEARQQPA